MPCFATSCDWPGWRWRGSKRREADMAPDIIMELKAAIRKITDRESLSEAEAHAAMGHVMDGQATPAQIAAFITALRMKGETVDEIAGLARAMRERGQRITPRAEA